MQSALEEIEKNGIVGLRVADVAASAEVSVPLIYKYFRDRDGLLAEVLSETITSLLMEDIRILRNLVETSTGRLDAAELAALMPMPSDPRRKRNRRLRVMATAASYDIPKLADALAANQRMMNAATHDLISLVRKRTGSTSKISVDAITTMLQALSFGLVIDDYEPNRTVTEDEYRALLIELFNLLIIE